MMGENLTLEIVAPSSLEAVELMDELSVLLERRYGSSGRDGFVSADGADAIVVVARREQELLGCGAVRPLHDHPGVVEIKRMYARPGTRGVGAAVLYRLEKIARSQGASQIWLETRRANLRAVEFYERAGYVERNPYGRYVGRPEAICLGKSLRGRDDVQGAPEAANGT